MQISKIDNQKIMMSLGKKGQVTLGDAPTLVRTLVIIAITLALGALILDGFSDSVVPEGPNTSVVASNVTQGGLAGLQEFGDFQDLMALVIVSVIILGLVLFIGVRQR